MKILRPSVIAKGEWYKDRDQNEWKRTRQQVLIRDHYTCTYCGFICQKFSQVNHIGAEDNHNPENLETVCRACHSVSHMGISAMQGTLTVFECLPEGENVAAIVAITRSLVAKDVAWDEIERQILARFMRPDGKHYGDLQSVGFANKMLHSIKSPDFRGYLPTGFSVCFHEEGAWNGYPERIWKWQILPGSRYSKS